MTIQSLHTVVMVPSQDDLQLWGVQKLGREIAHGFCYPAAGRYAGRVRHGHPSCRQFSRKLCHHKTCRPGFWCHCHSKRGHAEWLAAPTFLQIPTSEVWMQESRHSKNRMMFRQPVSRWFALDLPALPQFVNSLLPPPHLRRSTSLISWLA